MRQVKHGYKSGWVRREMLEGSETGLELWDDFMTPDAPTLVRKIQRVRDVYFAHWDDQGEVARSFIEEQAKAQDPVAFIESDEGGAYLKTRFPWAQAAIVHDLTKGVEGEDNLRTLIRDIGRLLGTTCNLLSRLITAIGEEQSLVQHCEPADARQEGPEVSGGGLVWI